MSLARLTDSNAVLKAIKEFDRIGRDVFLDKYGFGPARNYFLLHNGRFYDSKAIAGVAYGFEHPDEGPLKASDFGGGKNTVRPKLEDLGFRISRSGHHMLRRCK